MVHKYTLTDEPEPCCIDAFSILEVYEEDNSDRVALDMVSGFTCQSCGEEWIVNRTPEDQPDEWRRDDD